MKNAILYTRVSTDNQADNGFSLDHQLTVLKHYCNLKTMHIAIHFQEDYSAKNFNRPAWAEMMEYIQVNKKGIDCIVFTRWDRFSRNAEEAMKMIRRFQSLDIEIICMEQPLDLNSPDSKVMLALFLILPEVENDKNSQRTKEGMHEAKKQGFWIGCAPHGYKNSRDENGKSTLAADDNAEQIKESFQLMSTGLYSCEEVRKKINAKWNTNICKQAFANRVRNVTYSGRIFIPSWKKEDAHISQGIHEAIISIELYNQVQDVLNKRRRQLTHPKHLCNDLPLRGHLICPECNRNLTGSGSTGRNRTKHYYYHCHKECGFRFRADEANNKFLEYLSNIIKISEPVKRMYGKVMADIYKQKEGDKNKKITNLEEEIAKIKMRKGNAQDRLADKEMSTEDFNDIKRRCEEKLVILQSDLAEAKMTDINFLRYMEFALQLIEKIDYFYEISPLEVKHKILVSIFPEKLIFDAGKYRTTCSNEVISLITRKHKVSERNGNEKANKIVGSYIKAPSPGLEPGTP